MHGTPLMIKKYVHKRCPFNHAAHVFCTKAEFHLYSTMTKNLHELKIHICSLQSVQNYTSEGSEVSHFQCVVLL